MEIKTVNWLVSTVRDLRTMEQIDFCPDFQRNYVWSEKQKIYLIDTLINNFSVPKVYVSQRYDGENGDTFYDVIDGQQRLTTIINFINGEFKLSKSKHPKPDYFNSKYDGKYFVDLPQDIKKRILSYSFTVDLVEGDTRDISEMFLRLNLSNSTLNKEEIYHSQYSGDFMTLIKKISSDFLDDFLDDKIINGSGVRRMKDHRFITGCLITMIRGLTNKDKEHENVIREFDNWDEEGMDEYYERFKKIYKLITNSIFKGEIRTSRFNSLYGFISLFDYFHDQIYNRNKSLNKKQYDIVLDNLMWLGSNSNPDGYGIGKKWYDITQQGGDTIQNRSLRKEILESILNICFNQKDSRRSFTEEERKIMWESSLDKKCKISGKIIEKYEDYDLDHIIPYEKGGPTSLKNSQITLSSENRRKKDKIL